MAEEAGWTEEKDRWGIEGWIQRCDGGGLHCECPSSTSQLKRTLQVTTASFVTSCFATFIPTDKWML